MHKNPEKRNGLMGQNGNNPPPLNLESSCETPYIQQGLMTQREKKGNRQLKYSESEGEEETFVASCIRENTVYLFGVWRPL